MPASQRAHASRRMAPSSRPYDRCSPTASLAQSEHPLVHSHLLPCSPIQDPDLHPERTPDTPPDHPGLPTYADYKRIEAEYLHSLSPRKRDKALITQAMFDKIWDVLHQPEACTIETPQFRFWVRKMFSLSRPMCPGDGGWGAVRMGGTGAGAGTGTGTYPDMASDSDAEETDLELERAMGIKADASTEFFSAVVLHESRPVAIMEQLYDLFCYCHVRAGHGGRDKTCAVIRQHYSWVPKELTAQFVKACPTCALKRSGHGGVGVGVDMGMLVQRRGVGQRERRVRGTPLGAEEMPASVVPSSLGSMGWPTTGGPLDPANPEPCGVREREQVWLREREDTKTIDLSNLPMSPARVSIDVSASGPRTRSVPSQVPFENCLPRGWNGVPRALTENTSPFHLCDTTNRSVVGVTGFPQPFGIYENNKARIRNDWGEKRSPTRAGLPSLTSALSNESLDENISLTELGPETAGECLSPVLRPLRLSGPILSDTEPNVQAPPSSEPYLFQIDPVLLSFNYPGLVGLSESGSVSSGADSAMPLALSRTASDVVSSEASLAGEGHPGPGHDDSIHHVMNLTSGLYRPTSDSILSMPDLGPNTPPIRPSTPGRSMDPSNDDDDDDDDIQVERDAGSDPDSGSCIEHDDRDDVALNSYRGGSMQARSRGRLTSRRGGPSMSLYGRCESSLASMRYHCSAEETVGQGLDGPVSFSIVMDA